MKPKTEKQLTAEVAELSGENQRLRESIMRIGSLANICTYHDLNRTICTFCQCGRKDENKTK
jgi:hypothetical protein